jgi:uncharacterized membrane protein
MPEVVRRPPAALAARARRVALVAWTALALASAIALAMSGSAGARVAIAAFLLLPLALPLAGLLRHDRRTYAWATLCVTPHFVFGLTELIASPATRALSLTILVASLVLVGALVAYLRFTRSSAPSLAPD